MMNGIAISITSIRRGGGAQIITATIPPALGALSDGDTIASAMSADYDQTSNYDSSASPTIASVVPAATVNGTSALFTDTVDAGDVVVVTVTVTDGEGNVRPFNAGTQTVADIAPVATGGIADQSFTEDVAITPLDVSTDFTGTRLTFALAPSSAALPAGLSLSSAGEITGTPTTVAAEVNIVVRATNSAGTADTAFGVTIAEASTGPAATGGTETVITQGGNFYRVHTFLSSGSLVVVDGGDAEALVAGAGGAGHGGGSFGAGGGGSAGDVIAQAITLTAGTKTITVGEGGVCTAQDNATSGGDTSALGLTAIGGGRGGSRDQAPVDGGGGADLTNTTGAAHPTSFSGGDGTPFGVVATDRSGGGGRGAAGNGADAASAVGGDGGAATSSSINGTATNYGRGGGGGSRTTGGAPNGGSGTTGSAGINPGDGGGGGGSVGLGGPGADGIVIVRYEITEAEFNAGA